jgi:hypothetical protein
MTTGRINQVGAVYPDKDYPSVSYRRELNSLWYPTGRDG